MGKEFLTLRKEIKYVVPLEKALRIRDCLDRLLARDSHCAGGAYSVRSLYFESLNNMDFADKLSGVEIRKKVRARIYDGDGSLCKLELKEKKGDAQSKQSFLIDKRDVIAISQGDYTVLTNYFHETPASVRAYSIMTQGRYRPAVIIEYDRLAYRYPMYDTRITLDMNIRSSESHLNLFSQNIAYTPVLYENVVLEIKYSGKFMGFISDALSGFELMQNAYSKYCSGRRNFYDFNY